MKKVEKKKVSKKIWTEEKIKWFDEECQKWVKNYYLQDWVIRLSFEEKDVSDSDWTWWKTAASTDANSVYHKAVIKFYPTILKNSEKKWSGEETINSIKHELVHLITQEINDLAHDRYSTEKQINDAIEVLTQRISVIT